MKIGLHDAERDYFKTGNKFPNYAIMKISAYHKSRGDHVEWWNPLVRYDRVYSSKVFDFTPVAPYLDTYTAANIGRKHGRNTAGGKVWLYEFTDKISWK